MYCIMNKKREKSLPKKKIKMCITDNLVFKKQRYGE